MRVTVIATGLDDNRMRRDPGVTRWEESANVTPLRPEPRHAAPRSPAAEAPPAPARAEEPAPAPTAQPARAGDDDFMSPFEDEFDVPTFIRRGGHEVEEDDEDRDEPAFLRRSMD